LKYIELHARSAFSFLEGASLPEELAALCAELEIPAMALHDRDGVYGAPRFHMAAKKLSLRAHIGAEVTSPEGWRYALLAASREGYQNLCRVITRMKLRGILSTSPCRGKASSHMTLADLAEHTRGLICLTGGAEGPLAHALANGGLAAATARARELCELFGRENVYVELQRHFSRDEEARNQAAVAIARELSLPLLATGGVCHARPEQREVLDVFTALRHHRTLASSGRLLSRNAERHLKSPAEMARLFADLPEAIANTEELSSRLQFTLNDLGYQFPRYPVPDGGSQIDFLRRIAREGMIGRYGSSNERARQQIEHELAIIGKLDLAGYFLIVWDIVRFCREQSILVQGRGSAANSAVCYSLGITAVDPVGMELLFERFLSEERGEWPDIDLDLPSGDQRERAIQYVYQRYGQLGAAMTANVITYRGRSAAREIGKVLGFEPETLNKLSQIAGHWEYRDENDTLDRRFRDAGFDLRHPLIRKFADLCLRVQDLPRHLGQHSGGMVICQGQLDSVVPLELASMPGRVVVQWDKDDCTDMGIVKVDLLGLGMMAVLEESLEIIREKRGEVIDLGRLPADDPAVYGALQKADTVGMFQIESRAQMSCLPRLHPKCFYDIVVQVAIIRPGPIVGKMVNPYLQRRQGREAVTYAHPSLEPVLARTLGVPLFQEQLLRMAMIVAGFTGGQAEELRRAMGFKRSEARMQQIGKQLRNGMDKHQIAPDKQEEIIQSITSFALYGFPESHAASFALLAYASAYLKCHYLDAFTAAMLNNQPMGFYQPATLVKDAQRHGLKVRPIDVTCSDWPCTLEGIVTDNGLFAVRLGLRYVRGLRAEIAQELARQRALRPFASIDDLQLRVPAMRKDELTALAEIGALNAITGSPSGHRREALWQVERVARQPGPLLETIDAEPAGAKAPDVANVGMSRLKPRPTNLALSASQPLSESQPSLMSQSAPEPHFSLESRITADSPLAPMTMEERLTADFRGTGMTVGPHPMAYHRAEMKRQGIRPASDLARLPDGCQVRVAGSVIARQRPGTAKGFVFLSLEDETGIANAIVTPQLFEREYLVLTGQPYLIVEGSLQNQDSTISVKAQRVQALSFTRAETASHDFR
jgi:error-prone DNA polymerase